MLWNFYPEKEFQHLSIRGTLSWSESEANFDITVFGADPQYPLRLYGVHEEEYYYLGLMVPEEEKMNLTLKRQCPLFQILYFCIGRIEEEYTLVATGKITKDDIPKLEIDEVPKKKREGKSGFEALDWQKKIEPEQLSNSKKFLFAHPSTRANLKFYGHYCKIELENEELYAFAVSSCITFNSMENASRQTEG